MPNNESLSEVLDKAWEGKPLKEIIAQSPAVLQGVSDGDAAHLKEAFGINTVEDFAKCKYFLWAQALVTLAATEK